MRLKPGFFTLLLAGLLSACGADKPLATVDQVDLERYSGTWYEIARLPQWFQRGCYNSTATYSLNEDGTVRVVNRCQREDKEPSEAQGTARVAPGSDNAKLKVRFDSWISKLLPTITEGNYWIIALDKNYQTVVIGEPSREYLWILARTPQLPDDQYQALLQLAESKGFPVDELQRNRDLQPEQ
ncbi:MULTISPECIES: lipocalin family protein [Alcanivorax]|jgi:apolipoprotein D and lipocalin family protein|uniref:lipocalin family protein n=1 Tax=Alcanivorax TaxID=59753 RepID=UPI0023537F66|nr:lipocalin family protein [Alcanivorax jadensis]MDF1637633.1 lipocalin family protein [Alcanivorax jadensis]|tara:strand:+ start:2822 stop:3373 length:552 start_codon:yes stop_codon:yes gene_type:complete